MIFFIIRLKNGFIDKMMFNDFKNCSIYYNNQIK